MTTRLALSSIALSISLLACGGDADIPVAPDAGTPVDPGNPDPIPPDAAMPDSPAEPAPYELSVSMPKLPILAGSTETLEVSVTRHDSFTGEIAIRIANLPAGVTADPAVIAADATTTSVTVSASTAPHSLPTVVDVVGTSGSYRATTNATITIYGPPGSVDTSFGNVILPVGISDDYAYATAIQADGKVLLAGRVAEAGGKFAIVRLTRDGELDSTFGGTGKVTTYVGFGGTIHGLAIQPDGKIVAVGSATRTGGGYVFIVVRYMPDGSVDSTFGANGTASAMFGLDTDTAYAVVLQPDGKIVVGGDSNRGSSSTGVDFALARFNPDGSLDSTFGNRGLVVTALGAGDSRDSIYGLALQTIEGETRIVAVGGEGDFGIARYHANGTLDTTFNGTGKLRNPYGSNIGAARAVAVTPQNELVIAGQIGHQFAVAKLSQAGQVDPTFGMRRTQVTPSSWNEGQAIALDGDKILVAGWAYEFNSSSGNFAIVRYNANGELDPTFAGGKVITPVAAGTKPDQATSMALQIDERVPTVRAVVGGFASTSNSDFAVARYWR
ncbi:MAG: hypothetical protein HOV81_44985 [Kofleriaceae bacterium]|nr:hypothetical protein [Kofleriaceae bacterium]